MRWDFPVIQDQEQPEVKAGAPKEVRITARMDGVELTGSLPTVLDDDGLPKGFAFEAYSGGELQLGTGIPTYADLAEMELAKQDLPVFEEHNSFSPVGFTESLKIANFALTAKGKWLRPDPNKQPGDSDRVHRIRSYMAQGYPWEVSIGAAVRSAREYREGEEFVVNGRSLVGPALVLSTRLRELSVVGLGADYKTRALAASVKFAKEKETSMSGNANTEVTATAPAPATIAELRAEFGEDLSYCLDSAAAGLTMLQAQAGYAKVLREQLKNLRSAPAPAQRVETVQASAPVVTRGGAPSSSEADPVSAFKALLERKLEAGMSRQAAMREIAANHNGLRIAFVKASNSRLPTNTYVPSLFR